MQKDDATWLRTAYSAWALLTAFVFWKMFMFAGLKAGWLERYEDSFNIGSILAAVACGVLLTWFIARDHERQEYLLASIGELRKVQWPDWENTKKLTMIVCVVVAIFSVVLTVFDLAWAKILKLLLVA
jgi:preprotein translocase subunit SecE